MTGIYNAMRNTAHRGAPLFSVLYGQMLTLKLAFVTLAVGALAMVAVLMLAAVLGHTSPLSS
ncbi:hypothetical protein [Paraburkholderia sp. CI3]|uniref:hypothetical protein n=1 Tax=Paraburkholderia sp. CI3 TaxID=2991060 RepID=UPI003D2605D1